MWEGSREGGRERDRSTSNTNGYTGVIIVVAAAVVAAVVVVVVVIVVVVVMLFVCASLQMSHS